MNRPVLTVALNAAVDKSYVLDGLTPGAIHVVAEQTQAAGGKANNVARVLALLGAPVVATGFAGGAAGGFIQADLRRCGIQPAFTAVRGESRTCLAILDRAGGVLTEIRERGPEISPAAQAAFLRRFRRLAAGAAAVVMSGSLPPGVPPAFYARLVAAGRAAGAFTVLDTGGAALAAALPAGPDLVKPNREELGEWAGQPLTEPGAVRAAAERMCAAGARAVAVSLGPRGLLVATGAGAWGAQAPAVTAVNTVGSGDALVAGLVAARRQGLDWPDAIRLGVASGSANALTVGVAAPRLEDIERLRAMIVVAPLPD